ncbi:MAG: hypothetical protein ACRDZO_10380 [Egibacteraceae bacterium]
MTQRITELHARLGRNPRKSSVPPSSEGLAKSPRGPASAVPANRASSRVVRATAWRGVTGRACAR